MNLGITDASFHNIDGPDISHPEEVLFNTSGKFLVTHRKLCHYADFISPLSACLSDVQVRQPIWNLPSKITSPPKRGWEED